MTAATPSLRDDVIAIRRALPDAGGGTPYAAQGRRVAINPDPLEVVKRRDNVTALAAIRGRSREDKLRVWLALGGTEADFPEAREEVCAMQNIKVGRYENPDAGYLGWIEPDDASWIAFVRDDHVPEVYLDRDPETGAVI